METIKKNKYLYLTIVVLILVNLVLMAFLFMNRPGRHPSDKRANKKEITSSISRLLELSDAQKARFEAQLDAHLNRMKSVSENMEGTKKQLSQLLGQPENEDTQLLLDSLSTLHRAQEEEIFRHTQELYKICNEEQRDKLKKIYNQSFKRRRLKED